MRFLVDESAGAAVVEHLRYLGHDVLAVGEVMRQTDDDSILDLAEREARIVITNDKDFGELVFRRQRKHHGVLLLRLRDESAACRVRVVSAVLELHSDRLARHFVVATERGIRVRATKADA